jgi:hypothetical protein
MGYNLFVNSFDLCLANHQITSKWWRWPNGTEASALRTFCVGWLCIGAETC